MKKKIESEFEDKELDEGTEYVLNLILDKAIHYIQTRARIKKVSVDGNVYWLRDKG